MTGPRIDLNADVGELDDGGVVDAALLRVITSANVACGGHAGDEASMLRVCGAAASRGVAIGAQVSYVDRAGFGRRRLDVGPSTLRAQVRDQLSMLASHAHAMGTSVRYLKPHGALYHAAAQDPEVARAVVGAISDWGVEVPVLTLPTSELALVARAQGLVAFAEAFADRGYRPDGGLVPRGEPGDLVHDPEAVTTRVAVMARERAVAAIDGTTLRLRIDSVCVHSDTPGAVALAERVRAALETSGVVVAPCVQP